MLCRESTPLLFMRPFEYVGPTAKLEAIVDWCDTRSSRWQYTNWTEYQDCNLMFHVFPYTLLPLIFSRHRRMCNIVMGGIEDGDGGWWKLQVARFFESFEFWILFWFDIILPCHSTLNDTSSDVCHRPPSGKSDTNARYRYKEIVALLSILSRV